MTKISESDWLVVVAMMLVYRPPTWSLEESRTRNRGQLRINSLMFGTMTRTVYMSLISVNCKSFCHSLIPILPSLQYHCLALVRSPPPTTALTLGETPFPLPSPQPTSPQHYWTRLRQPQPFPRWLETQVTPMSMVGLATPPSPKRAY